MQKGKDCGATERRLIVHPIFLCISVSMQEVLIRLTVWGLFHKFCSDIV